MAVSASTSLNSNGLNFGGLISGIDSSKIIDGINSIAKSRVTRFQNQQAEIRQKSDAVTGLQTQLAGLQLSLNQLSRSAGSAFDSRLATSSNDDAVSATAGSAATPGTYTITVNSLAKADQRASQGFADQNTLVKTGTLTLQSGTGTPVTITVDERNNTLQGLADSINAAGNEIKASVINDGTATPYRLLLTATKSGASNAISTTNNLTGGTGASIDPTNTTIQAASDAQVTLGSGAGALTVSSSTNQLNSLVPGVSINLKQADATKPIQLSVTNDTTTAASAVKEFVTSYNKIIDYVGDQQKYDSATSVGGPLLGNRDVQNLQNDLISAVTATIPGLSKNANRLSSVGVALDDSGHLQLDEARLNQALSGNNGATIGDIKKLFGLTGSSDNIGVQFQFGTSKTKPSGGTPYTVDVTAVATRATLSATNDLAASIVIDGTNNALNIKLNGFSSTALTLDAGTYTRQSLATALQGKINANSGLSGNVLSVDLNGDKLRFTSQAFGSASKIEFFGGSALSALGLSGIETNAGTDVAGRFLVNGQAETASGTGQQLKGTSGNKNTDGLQVKVTLNTPGTAQVAVSQGLAGRLNEVVNKYLDATTGRLPAVTAEFQRNIDDIQGTIDKQNNLISEQTDKLTQQFAAMETAISNLRNVGTQLAGLTK